MDKELDEEERQKILDAVSKFLNRDNLFANRIVTYPHTPSIEMDSIGDTNPNDIVHLYLKEKSDFINGEFKRKKCLVADYWIETNILWHIAWLPMEQFPEAYEMFLDKYEQLDGDNKATKEEIEEYREELKMWWGPKKEKKDYAREQEKELIIKNAFEFLKRDDLVLAKEPYNKIISKEEPISPYEISYIHAIVNYDTLIIYYNKTMLKVSISEYEKLYELFQKKYRDLLFAQQAEQQSQDTESETVIDDALEFLNKEICITNVGVPYTTLALTRKLKASDNDIFYICDDNINNVFIIHYKNKDINLPKNHSNKKIRNFILHFKAKCEELLKQLKQEKTEQQEQCEVNNIENCVCTQQQDTTDYSIKYDQGKHKLSQFPREAMEAVAEVMEYGARKYGKGSWNRVGIERYIDAAARHLYAMQDRDENGRECINLSKKDDESGLEHLYHLACNVVYAVAIYRREKNEKVK